MKFIKKFESFIVEEASPSPAVKPTTKPAEPAVKPHRPSPIRRDKPAVTPAPKAKLPKKSTAEAVAERFIREINQKGDSVKNYIK